MFAQLKHVAIVSEQYTLLGRFYEGMFGMKPSQNARPFGAVVVRDGYVGLNINPRKGKAGRQAGLDHFGFEVEDVNVVFDRLKKDYPDIKHIALRAVKPGMLAKFYREVFELTEMEKPADDPNFYLSDGKVIFVIMPWDITDFAGTGIERPALDHIGFKVESVDAVKSELAKVKRERAALAPNPIGADAGPEGEARLSLFAKCPLGQFHMSDPDGVLIDVSDR